MKNSLSFDDVLLVPKYSEVMTRKDIVIKQSLKNVGDFSLPIISSPMDTSHRHQHGPSDEFCRWSWNYSQI